MPETEQPKILIFPFELFSHYLRCIEIAKILSHDYHVKIQYSERYNSFVREAGFETFNCLHFNANEVINCVKNFDFSWLNYSDLENIYKKQVNAILENKPALVIGDTAQTLKMAAEKCHTPYISLLNGYMTKYYAVRKIIPSSHYAKPFSKKMPPFIFNSIADIAERVTYRKIHKPFSLIRSENKLTSKQSYLEEIEGDFNFICDIPELFPQKKLPSNYMMIGALFHKSRKNEDELLKICKNGKKNILVSIGSTGNSNILKLLYHQLFENYNILVSTQSPSNSEFKFIRSKDFINHCAILKYIDIMICHGGNGTVNQSLSFGVPVLCATTIFEQEWNVQRIDELGLGENISHIINEDQLLVFIKKWESKKGSLPLKKIQNSINTSQQHLFSKESGFLAKIKEIAGKP
jgi:UDP:flavonoid glycosyltransferase YjiC (YdhE family)